MNVLFKLSAILLLITVSTVYSRVPMPPNSFQAFRRQPIIQNQPIIHHQTIIQHPPVLTRPPTRPPANTTEQSQSVNKTKSTTVTSTTTTAEPPEIEDDIFPHQQMLRARPSYNNYDYYYNYNYAPTTYAYDYLGLGFGFNGVAGGTSREVEYDYSPPDAHRPSRRQNPRPAQKSKSTTTTKSLKTTTQKTTTETPEPDDDIITKPATEKFTTRIQETYTGYCFCSPLSKCPVDSIPRGGLCQNFLAYFTSLRFIRCCYSPSVARSLQL